MAVEQPPSEPRYDVAALADRLAHGLYTQLTAVEVANSPRALELLPPVPPGQVRAGALHHKDGSVASWDSARYLEELRSDGRVVDDLRRLWLSGALLALGDALADHDYFDRAPELEMIRHLRNGVTHGNRFNFTLTDAAQLAKHPAHTRSAPYATARGTWFEITPALAGSIVLFDFMQAADIVLLLLSVGLHLRRTATGLPGRP